MSLGDNEVKACGRSKSSRRIAALQRPAVEENVFFHTLRAHTHQAIKKKYRFQPEGLGFKSPGHRPGYAVNTMLQAVGLRYSKFL